VEENSNNGCNVKIRTYLHTYIHTHRHAYIHFLVALRPNAGHGLLILEVSRSHNDSPQSVGLSGQMNSSSQRPIPDYTQHPQQTSMPPAGFELTMSEGQPPHTYALDRAATGTGTYVRTFISTFVHTYRHCKHSTYVHISY